MIQVQQEYGGWRSWPCQINTPSTQHPRSGFTIREHCFDQDLVGQFTLPEEIIEHFIARIFPLGDGPRRLKELHERLGEFLAHEARKRVGS